MAKRRSVGQAGGAFKIRALTARDGPVVEQLFGSNGACAGCWCMWARLPRGGKLWEQSKGEPNRRSQLELIRSGGSHALLAFEDGAPIGWCSLGPRGDFPRLERVKAARSNWDERTWSVVCFFVPARQRGRGLASALLEAAVEYARKHGAHALEGYPVRASRGGEDQIPAAFAWTGVARMFEKRGFVRESPRGARELWKLELDRAPKSDRPSAPRARIGCGLGPVSERWLASAGIVSRADLERTGAVAAFDRVRRSGVRASINLLYALEACLLEVHWTKLPRDLRERLRRAAAELADASNVKAKRAPSASRKGSSPAGVRKRP